MKFNDFSWDDIILEAPIENDETEEELSATDYTDSDNIEVEEVEEEDIEADDYTNMEEELDDEDSNDTVNDDLNEEDYGDEQLDEGNEELDDEQQNNDENDTTSIQNKYLVHDFIELFKRQEEILEKIREDNKLNSLFNPTIAQIKRNIDKLKDVTYDYITNKFANESYIANLYQFNLIIQAMNINIQMLDEVSQRRKVEEDGKKKKVSNKKKSTSKK